MYSNALSGQAHLATWPTSRLGLPVQKKMYPAPTCSNNPKHVVIVGSGVSGLVAAYTCCKEGGRDVKVTMIEQRASPGGHAMTVPGPNGEALDIGLW